MNDKVNKRPLLLRVSQAVLPQRLAEDVSLRIVGDRIGEIADGTISNRESESIDLDGLTLFPGFIDLHIHGAVGVDTLVASASDLGVVSEFLAKQGVTSWVPTLVPAAHEQYESAVQAITHSVAEQQAKPATGARVLGVHYEGPFVNEAQCGALRREYFKTFASHKDIEQLPLPTFVGAVKVMTIAPEIEGGVDLVTELVKRNWVVSIGHTRADVKTLDRALSAGANHMTHFMNAMAPLHHRAPGPIGWGLLHDDVTCDFIADGIHLDPLVLKLLLRTKGAERLSMISDAIAPTGMPDGGYQIWGQTIEVTNGKTSNAHGTIAGSVISMLDAVRKMRALGASDLELARMAGTNPAKLLRIDDECGSIETGKRADLVALDSNGNVKLTIVGGEVAYSAL
jgi:N-acetylglucosamine-6-phosphate deacetylase